MAKQRRVSPTRAQNQKKKAVAKAQTPPSKATPPSVAQNGRHAKEAPAPAPVPRPTFYEAIALYESGVRALQRHEFAVAAGHFRSVLERYPEERELHERARLYLRVCERETARRPAGPQTSQERVYAATVSLNAGDPDGALVHLRRALSEAPDSDHAHYIMAVALTMRGLPTEALEHLRQAVALNPDNRALARQDPDLDALRLHDGFHEVVDSAPGIRRRPARNHRTIRD